MHPLDNPIWKALNTSLARFAKVGSLARRFLYDVTPLGGFEEATSEAYESLASILDSAGPIGLFFESPAQPPAGWGVLGGGPLLQMIYKNGHSDGAVKWRVSANEIIELTAADAPEMLALAQLTKPGPFGLRTHELGTYIGIRQEGRRWRGKECACRGSRKSARCARIRIFWGGGTQAH